MNPLMECDNTLFDKINVQVSAKLGCLQRYFLNIFERDKQSVFLFVSLYIVINGRLLKVQLYDCIFF